MTTPTIERIESHEAHPGRARGLIRRNLQLILGLLISAWSVWQLSRALDLGKMGEHFADSNLGLLLLSVLLIAVNMIVKTVRWRYLFANREAPPFGPLLSSLYIGYLMNTVLPARIGELVRAYLVGRHDRLGTPAALGTIVLEKVLDLSTLALILATLVLARQLPGLPEWMAASAYVSSALILIGVIVLLLMVVGRRRVIGLLDSLEQRVRLLRRFPPSELAASVLDGLARLGRADVLPSLLAWSALTWTCAALSLWTGLAGVGISAGLSAVLLTLVVTNIGMAVPSAPGYVGAFHLLLVESLAPFGIDRNHATGAAIIIHAIVFGNFIMGGLWCLWRGGHSFGELRAASAH